VVIGTLADIGYSSSWRVLDAQHFGVPQRRRRVFIVGRRIGDGLSSAEVLFKSEGLRRNTKTHSTTGQNTTTNTSSSTREAGWLTTNPGVTTTVTSKWYKGAGGPSGSEHYNLVLENDDLVQQKSQSSE
jgi:DNA (cytosine-5)-methyltransferase 1